MAEIREPIENFGLSKKDKPKTQFGKVGLVGCGAAGQKIAILIASRGIEIVCLDQNAQILSDAKTQIENELTTRINHWGLTEGEKKAIVSRMKFTTDYDDFHDCDLVIEAILAKNREENRSVRIEVFKKIEAHVSKECIIATNSTTTVITEFAAELEFKNRCVSLHISTTAPEANLVEVVKGLYTSEETYNNVQKFCKLINKTPIHVSESPGLITVRIFVSLISEACDALMEGVAKMEEIDFSMRNGFGLPLGPFEMADKIGLDKVIMWMDNLYEEFGDVKYKSAPILKRLVRANHLGRKTGEGFYKYDEKGQKIQPTFIK